MADFIFRGERLKTWRTLLGIRQGDLAEKVGISRTQITNLETGHTEPSVPVLVALARELHVTTDWLLGLSDVPAYDAEPALVDAWLCLKEAEDALDTARQQVKAAFDALPTANGAHGEE